MSITFATEINRILRKMSESIMAQYKIRLSDKSRYFSPKEVKTCWKQIPSGSPPDIFLPSHILLLTATSHSSSHCWIFCYYYPSPLWMFPSLCSISIPSRNVSIAPFLFSINYDSCKVLSMYVINFPECCRKTDLILEPSKAIKYYTALLVKERKLQAMLHFLTILSPLFPLLPSF